MNNKKIELIEKIKNFDSNEKKHVFNLIKRYSINYSKNSNGVFVDFEKIDNILFEKLDEEISNIKKKKENISMLETQRDTYMNYCKNLMIVKQKEEEEKQKLEYLNMLTIEDVDPDYTVSKYQIEEFDENITSLEFFKNYKIYDDKQFTKNKDSVYYRISQKLNCISKNKTSLTGYNYIYTKKEEIVDESVSDDKYIEDIDEIEDIIIDNEQENENNDQDIDSENLDIDLF